jgi:hypothetical protein
MLMDTLYPKSPDIEKDLVPNNCLGCGLRSTPDCPKDKLEIYKLRLKGHSYHCAIRQVWGDGECTCAKGGTDNQNITKEESVSTHTEGGGGSPLKSPDYMEGYVDGYNDCRDFANGKINSLLERLKCQNKPT